MDINKIKSGLQMQNLHFSDIQFERNKIIEDGDFGVNISKDIKEIGEHKYTVSVCVNIDKSDFSLYVKAQADFIYHGDFKQEQAIVNTNTIAIIFPYVRSQVTLITSQPDMQPILLPAINTSKLK